MTDLSSQPDGGQTASGSTPTLRLFVAYADGEARAQAWHLYRFMAENLAGDLEVSPVFCEFAALTCRETVADSTRTAAEADVVIFSTGDDPGLPALVKAWTEYWVRERTCDQGGLLLLIEHLPVSSRSPSAKATFLREAAQRAGMDFLAQKICPPPAIEIREARRGYACKVNPGVERG